MKVLLPIIWHPLTHCIARAFAAADRLSKAAKP